MILLQNTLEIGSTSWGQIFVWFSMAGCFVYSFYLLRLALNHEGKRDKGLGQAIDRLSHMGWRICRRRFSVFSGAGENIIRSIIMNINYEGSLDDLINYTIILNIF